MVELANTIWADGPAGSPSQPEKPQIRAWGSWIENSLSAALNGTNWYLTKTDASSAAAGLTDGTLVIVYGDSITDKNGSYRVASGLLVKATDFVPGWQVVFAHDDGASTANSYSMLPELFVPQTDGAVLVFGQIPETNTSAHVSITFDGGVKTYAIKTASGNDPSIGALVQGLPFIGQISSSGSVFRLLSDIASSAIQAASENAALLSRSWAEGTAPGGVGTKSSKEWAQVAGASVTFAMPLTPITGDGSTANFTLGIAPQSVNNVICVLGGLLQLPGTDFTVSGTTLTFPTVPESGVSGFALVIGSNMGTVAPLDGSVTTGKIADANVTRAKLASGMSASLPINAAEYGAVFDGSPSDNAKIKTAALAAIAAGLPFMVPPTGNVVIQVPEDVSDLQAAINGVSKWVFPRNIGVQATPYAAPYLVTISVADNELVTSGKGFVWTLPKGGAGDLVLLAGRNKSSITINSLYAQTALSGIIFVTVNVAAIPAGMAIGSYITMIVSAGTGEHYATRGCWQVSAVDTVNKRITFKVNVKGDTSISGLDFTASTAFFIPTVLRFTNMPFDGADRGGIDIQENCRLSIKDIVLSGDSSGTNAASTNGIIARKGASLRFEQHVGVYGFQRNGVWLVEDGSGDISYGAISYCSIGVNMLTGSKLVGDYIAVTGNTSHNVVVGVGSSMSAVPATLTGTPGNALYVLNGGTFITSLGGGLTRISKSGYGVVAETGGIVHLNDAPVVSCTVGASARSGSRIFTNGVFTSNGTDYKPAINTLSYGAIISNNYATDL